jgi:hypothetical protein
MEEKYLGDEFKTLKHVNTFQNLILLGSKGKFMRKILGTLFVTVLVTGCSTLKTDQAVPLLQAETAKMLGLGSSDEITVTNVNGSQPDALGGQKLSYRATTEKGRIFDCSSMMMPGLLSAPTLSTPNCTPVVTHK